MSFVIPALFLKDMAPLYIRMPEVIRVLA